MEDTASDLRPHGLADTSPQEQGDGAPPAGLRGCRQRSAGSVDGPLCRREPRGASSVHKQAPCAEGTDRWKEEAGRSGGLGGRVRKRGNVPQGKQISAGILDVYIEALMQFGHVYPPDGLSTLLP